MRVRGLNEPSGASSEGQDIWVAIAFLVLIPPKLKVPWPMLWILGGGESSW